MSKNSTADTRQVSRDLRDATGQQQSAPNPQFTAQTPDTKSELTRYTTGDIARMCSVSVRTVQYYDQRGILRPAEVSDGGRRIYCANDVNQLRVICFLRGIGLKLDQIKSVLADEHPEQVISDLLEQQQTLLQREVSERSKQLREIALLQRTLNGSERLSLNSLPDMATVMNTTTNRRTTLIIMLVSGIALDAIEIGTLIFAIRTGLWWPFAIGMLVVIGFAAWLTKFYHDRVRYLCPACHTVFQPSMREFIFAAHTPRTRKLRCPTCGRCGHCMEVGTATNAATIQR
ncbi:MerR family transcriptional regulator [Bifidobacterium subtile]|jgi:DNA-binding transcriptional MerR regulator|uniref:Transcriptional regulator, MerR family n=1 Tax=Bifidobacterium subtile TaxID=77635 RepID=A0A087DTN9_9BIFI|nr:MerR family transcriptional regulator [Bifidobacterium subtile]KFI98889.1 transcriptional regulator, MerR family [Bifidobacterium subtile]QOL36415.1 MerR family transcriptional regulator [Bifidobacterium subtile]